MKPIRSSISGWRDNAVATNEGKFRGFNLINLLLAVVISAGCSGPPHPGRTKQQGVYTIVAVEGRPQDMPDTGYRVCRVFNHGIMPAAVVTGYGSFDGTYSHPQDFTLQVVETTTGTVVMTRSGEAFYGKSMVYDLPIQKTGSYRLKLIINGSVYDTWDFVVNTEETADSVTSQSSEKPGQEAGRFHFKIDRTTSDDTFTEYDKLFLNDLSDATKVEGSDPKIFSQAPAGKVVIQFDLDPKGYVHSATIVKNTLNREQGTFFLRALEHGTPYRPWPPNARKVLGSGTRIMVVTCYFEQHPG